MTTDNTPPTDQPAPPGARRLMADTLRTARRHRAVLSLVALVAVATVILSAALSDHVYRCEAEVTALFDDERGKSLMLEFTGSDQGMSSGMGMLVSRPRGQLFPLILASRSVSRQVLDASYRYVEEGVRRETNLYEYLGVENPDAARFVLRSRVAGFYLDPATGATKIVVRANSPEMALQITERYVDALASTLNQLRAESIRLNLELIEEKIADADAALAKAETTLQALRDTNRDYRTTLEPGFYVQQLRLEREIDMHESIVVALQSQHELTMSRLLDRERRITVITPPVMPTVPDSPVWDRAIALALAVGVVVFAIAAFVLTVIARGTDRNRRWGALARVLRADATHAARAVHPRKRAA